MIQRVRGPDVNERQINDGHEALHYASPHRLSKGSPTDKKGLAPVPRVFDHGWGAGQALRHG